MSEPSSSKRRHSTPPSPPRSGLSDEVGSLITERPPRKKRKSSSTGEDGKEEGSRSHSLPKPLIQEQSLLSRPGQRPLSPKASTQSSSFSGLGLTVPQDHQSRTSEGTSAVSGISQSKQASQRMTSAGLEYVVRQNNRMSMPEEESWPMPEQDLWSFVNDFVFNSVMLSQPSFPPLGQPQKTPQNLHLPADGSQNMPFTLYDQNGVPNMPTITPTSSMYPAPSPATETASFGQRMQAQQYPTSPFLLASQQSYSMPTAHSQTSQTQPQASDSQMQANVQGDLQQPPLRPTDFMPISHPHQIDPSARPGPSPQQPTIRLQPPSPPQPASAQSGDSAYKPENLLQATHQTPCSWQSMLNPTTAHQATTDSRQQAQSGRPSTQPGSSRHHSPLSPTTYPNPDATHSQTDTAISQQQHLPPPQAPMLVHATPAPQQQSLPPPQESPQKQEPTTTLPSPHQSPLTPIDPLILSARYTWTQLESAQLTLVGTLADLVRRARSKEVGLNVEERRVRAVTTHLINTMTLWWILRRERGW